MHEHILYIGQLLTKKSLIQILGRPKHFAATMPTQHTHTGNYKFCKFKSCHPPSCPADLLVVNPQHLKFIHYLYPKHLANELDLTF